MREAFQKRTGVFRPEDPWFEARSRAFWDDALTSQGFAGLATEHVGEETRPFVARLARAHRGLFVVDDRDDVGARLVDVWSGAELLVHHTDEAQALALDHAEGLMDARVVGTGDDGALFVLPGAFHHTPDASEPVKAVLAAARERGMATEATLDALLRMELVFKSSSRVKVSFAYRVASLRSA